MLDYLFLFCIVSFCYSSTFRGIENQNVLLEISVSSLPVLLFAWCMWFFVFVSCFPHLDLDFPNLFALIPSLIWVLPPFLIETYVECGNSRQWESECIAWKFFIFISLLFVWCVWLSFLFYFFVFYLPRSRSPRCFALTASSALLIESYGVSVGMSSAAASHSHCHENYMYTNWIQSERGGGGGERKREKSVSRSNPY